MSRQEFDNLTPYRDFSRRDFVRTSVGSGFTAAVLPVCAQTTIKTNSEGLLAGEVMIPVSDFKLPAYRAAPAGKEGAMGQAILQHLELCKRTYRGALGAGVTGSFDIECPARPAATPSETSPAKTLA